MNLQEIRQKYPQYDDLSDEALADGFYRKFYADMDRAEFDAKIGLTPEPAASEAAQASVTAQSEDPVVERGALLPLGRTESGELTLALPEFLAGPLQIVSDILAGRKTAQDVTPEEVLTLGFTFGGLSAATGTAKGVAAARGATAPARTGSAATEAAKRIGVDLPRAVGSDRSTVQQAGKIVQAVPGGGQPLRRASEQAIGQLDEAAKRVEQGFGQGSAVTAGDTIERGVTAFAGQGGVLAQRAAARLDRVDQMVDPAMKHGLSETADVAAKIAARRKEAGIATESQAAKLIDQAIKRPEGLTYQGLKTLRTYIGEIVDKPSLLPSDISGAELKQIYKALTTDLKSAVKAGGGETALKAWETANAAFQKSMGIRENLSRILKANSDEAIFAKLEGMAGATSRADLKTLAQVRAAVGKDGWGEVASAFIGRIGRDAEGNFSPERFLTGWGKISPDAKRILFKTSGQEKLASALDDIATVSSRFKALKQFANPSGTGQTVIGAGLGASGVSGLFGSISAPLIAAGTVLGARVMSNVLAKPQTAAPFATWAKAYGAFAAKPTAQTATALRTAARGVAAAIVNDMGGDRAEQDRLEKAFASVRQGA